MANVNMWLDQTCFSGKQLEKGKTPSLILFTVVRETYLGVLTRQTSLCHHVFWRRLEGCK